MFQYCKSLIGFLSQLYICSYSIDESFSTLLKINRPIINIRDVLKMEVLIKEKLNIVFLNTKYLRHSITDVIGLSITMLLYFSGTELSDIYNGRGIH